MAYINSLLTSLNEILYLKMILRVMAFTLVGMQVQLGIDFFNIISYYSKNQYVKTGVVHHIYTP